MKIKRKNKLPVFNFFFSLQIVVLSEIMSKTVENQQTKELSDDDDDETNDETDEEGDIYDNPEDIITLNIGGVRHETRIQTLR